MPGVVVFGDVAGGALSFGAVAAVGLAVTLAAGLPCDGVAGVAAGAGVAVGAGAVAGWLEHAAATPRSTARAE
jgi:hypothetical protein